MTPVERKRRIKQALANSTEFHPKGQSYVPELELSKLKKTSFSGSEFPTNMAWFLGQPIKVVEPVSNVDQGELNL